MTVDFVKERFLGAPRLVTCDLWYQFRCPWMTLNDRNAPLTSFYSITFSGAGYGNLYDINKDRPMLSSAKSSSDIAEKPRDDAYYIKMSLYAYKCANIIIVTLQLYTVYLHTLYCIPYTFNWTLLFFSLWFEISLKTLRFYLMNSFVNAACAKFFCKWSQIW